MFSNNDFSNLVEKNFKGGTKGYFDPNREKPQRGEPNHFLSRIYGKFMWSP
jgi:hypothetical protein